MKQFDVPPFYRSSLIGEIKNKRKLEDPRKKDFTPTQVKVGDLTFYIARHFGFCYGVEIKSSSLNRCSRFCLHKGISCFRYFSIIRPAIGAATSPPNPAFST